MYMPCRYESCYYPCNNPYSLIRKALLGPDLEYYTGIKAALVISTIPSTELILADEGQKCRSLLLPRAYDSRDIVSDLWLPRLTPAHSLPPLTTTEVAKLELIASLCAQHIGIINTCGDYIISRINKGETIEYILSPDFCALWVKFLRERLLGRYGDCILTDRQMHSLLFSREIEVNSSDSDMLHLLRMPYFTNTIEYDALMSSSSDSSSKKYIIPESAVIIMTTALLLRTSYDFDISYKEPILSLFNLCVDLPPSGSGDRGAQGVSEDTQGMSEGTQGVSEGAQGVSEGAQGVSEGAQGVSEGAQGVFEGAQGVSEGAQGVSEGAQGVFEGAQSVSPRQSLLQGIIYNILKAKLLCDMRCNDIPTTIADFLNLPSNKLPQTLGMSVFRDVHRLDKLLPKKAYNGLEVVHIPRYVDDPIGFCNILTDQTYVPTALIPYIILLPPLDTSKDKINFDFILTCYTGPNQPPYILFIGTESKSITQEERMTSFLPPWWLQYTRTTVILSEVCEPTNGMTRVTNTGLIQYLIQNKWLYVYMSTDTSYTKPLTFQRNCLVLGPSEVERFMGPFIEVYKAVLRYNSVS